MTATSPMLCLFNHLAHGAFSVAEDGTVAMLRVEGPSRSITLLPQGRPGPLKALIRQSTLANLGFGEGRLGPGIFDPTGRKVAFSYGGIMVMDAKGGGLRRLTRRPVALSLYGRGAGIANALAEHSSYLQWLPDGSHILAVIRGENGAELWEYRADGAGSRRLLSGAPSIKSYGVSPSGRWVAVVTSDGDRGECLMIDRGAAPGERALRLPWGEHGRHHIYRYPKVLWGKDDQTLILRGAGEGASTHYRLTLGDGKVEDTKALTDKAFEDGELILSPGGDEAIVSARVGDVLEERMFRIRLGAKESATGEAEALELPRGGIVMPVAWRGERLFFTLTRAGELGDLYVLDLATSRLERLTQSGEERGLPGPIVESVVIKGAGGNIPALLYTPQGLKKPVGGWPAIVWCHGGPVVSVQMGGAPMEWLLAQEGFVVLTPAFRGSAGQGLDHMYQGLGANIGLADRDDVIKAGRWLAEREDIRPDGVAIGGKSWGGYLTFQALTSGDHPFACGWAGAGLTDWFIQQRETEVRYYDRQLLGGYITDGEVAGRARKRSPITYVKRLDRHLLITHGAEDRDCPPKQIHDFVDAADPTLVELLMYPEEGHINRKPENIIDEHVRALTFLRTHLADWDDTQIPCGGQVLY